MLRRLYFEVLLYCECILERTKGTSGMIRGLNSSAMRSRLCRIPVRIGECREQYHAGRKGALGRSRQGASGSQVRGTLLGETESSSDHSSQTPHPCSPQGTLVNSFWR